MVVVVVRLGRAEAEKALLTSAEFGIRCSTLFLVMDALKAEIASKRKIVEDSKTDARPTKYMRRADVERLREEQERKAREEKGAEEVAKQTSASKASEKSKGGRVSLIPFHVRCVLISGWRAVIC